MSGRLSDPWWNQSESEWKEKNAWIWHLLQRTSFKFHWSLSRGTKLIPMIMTQFEMSINNRQLFYEIGVNSGRLFSELRSMEQGKYSGTSYRDLNEWLVLVHTQKVVSMTKFDVNSRWRKPCKVNLIDISNRELTPRAISLCLAQALSIPFGVKRA